MEKKVGFKEALKLFWQNYVNFKGRSRRSEYWYMTLWHIIFMIPAYALIFIGMVMAIAGFGDNNGGVGTIGLIVLFLAWIYLILYALATFIPNISILVRRFHDTGRSMLMPLIGIGAGIFGYIILIIISSMDPEFNSVVSILFSLIIYLIMIGLGIYNFVITLLDREPNNNKYGPSPKYHSQNNHVNNQYNSNI